MRCAHEKRLLGICATSASKCSPYLLRQGSIFTGHRHWSRAHLRWLAGQAFDHPAQQIVFQDQVDAVADATRRCGDAGGKGRPCTRARSGRNVCAGRLVPRPFAREQIEP